MRVKKFDLVKCMWWYQKVRNKLRTLSGALPLTFRAKAGTLRNYRIYGNTETKTRSYSGSAPLSFPITDGAVSNYRIYGNTVNGESVGDKTENLFDESLYNKNVADGTMIYVPIYVGNVDYVTCSTTCPKTGDSVHDGNNSRYIFFISGRVDAGAQNAANGVFNGAPRTIQPSNGYVTIAYRKIENYNVRPWEYQTMLSSGSTALPYEPYGYCIPITNNSETANIYLNEPLRMVGDEADYVNYATQKWHRVRKNLLKITRGNMTIGRDNDDPVTYPGVTITINADKSITFNGRARSTLYIPIGSIDDLKKGSYYLSGCPINGADNSYKLYVQNQSITSFDIGSGVRFNYISSLSTLSALIRLYGGYTCDNLTFYPMIRKADIEDDTYEPYIENTEVDVTIPALPAQSSSNFLSVGTAVQPSSVAVDVDEVVSCGDMVTDSQSVNYGKYKIPVILTAGSTETTNIFLDAPLAKSGNSADYIDYATKKRHNSDGTESNVTLPAISTLAGTNTLTVGTEVQPSGVEIKGRIKAIDD